MLGIFVKLFKRFATLSFPRGKSVCAPSVYNDCRRRRTGELRSLREDQEAALGNKGSISDELFALSQDVRIFLSGWAFLC